MDFDRYFGAIVLTHARDFASEVRGQCDNHPHEMTADRLDLTRVTNLRRVPRRGTVVGASPLLHISDPEENSDDEQRALREGEDDEREVHSEMFDRSALSSHLAECRNWTIDSRIEIPSCNAPRDDDEIIFACLHDFNPSYDHLRFSTVGTSFPLVLKQRI